MKFPAGATKPSLGKPVTSESLPGKISSQSKWFCKKWAMTGTFADLWEFAFLKQLFPQKNISVSYLKESRKWKCFLFQTTATSEFPYFIIHFMDVIPYYIILYHLYKKKILYHNIACSVLGEKFQPGSGPGQFCKPTSTQVQYIDCQMDIENFIFYR